MGPQGWDRKPEINNLCPPCPKDASYHLKRIGVVAIKKNVKMFKCAQTLPIMFGPALGAKPLPQG
jgi:hypothetical protein